MYSESGPGSPPHLWTSSIRVPRADEGKQRAKKATVLLGAHAVLGIHI